MPSKIASPEPATRRVKRFGLSLAGRVALATAAAGALAAILAAAVSWTIATELIDQAEIERLKASVQIFHNDLDMRRHGATVHEAIEGELIELEPASIRLAVYEGGQRIAGDALPLPDGECAMDEHGGVIRRYCAGARGKLTVVASTTRASGASTRFLVGAGIASLVAALIAAVVGQRAARWAIFPLRRFTQSLDRVRAEEPSADSLPQGGNVNEVEALRDALASLVGRLSESLTRARRFSADAAHELRTPLTVLSGQLDLLLEESSEEAARADLLLLQRKVRALARLVERLLVLATSEERILDNAQPVALEDVARQCVDSLSEPERARILLDIQAQGMTNGDESLLAILVDNAVDNALKFSGDAEVTVGIREAAGQVLVEVVDQGPGLAEDERERAFDAFFRSPTARAGGLPGHGIGLALVAQVARQHRGSCAFLETPKGAHLRVALPLWQPQGA